MYPYHMTVRKENERVVYQPIDYNEISSQPFIKDIKNS